jgi:hypothetical protein
MNTDYFSITYEGKHFEIDIEKCNFYLWKANDFDWDKNDLLLKGLERIGLFIEIVGKEREIESGDLTNPRIYTEWLDIPVSLIKNKDFRSLNNLVINYDDSQEIYEINGKSWENEGFDPPGALYVFEHGSFKKVTIHFNHLEQRLFNIKLDGVDEFGSCFEVSVNIPLEIRLTAYNNRATKEDILNFFNRMFNSDEFNKDWRYEKEDLFFTATPRN